MDKAEEVYERIISPIESRMTGIISRVVGDPDDAADVLQETLAVVWRKLERLDRHPDPQSYILRICLSRSYDALRKRARRRRERPLEGSIEASQSAGGGDAVVEREALSAIHEAIGALPPKQGQAVLLRAVDGSTYSVIAKIMGCSEVTARSHFSKGRARLREVLSELGLM